MNKLDTTIDLNNLYAIYKDLLTLKQQEVYELYYYEDESIVEIAKKLDISKNAIYSSLKNTEKVLINYENTLHIYYNYEFNITYLESFEINKEIINNIK